MVQALLEKLPLSDQQFAASIPWDGVLTLSAHWAGAGSLFDWIGPHDWEIERAWPAGVAQARMARAILLHIQQNLVRHLPRHAGEWADALSQQTHRIVHHTDAPSAHTDWVATLSTFGKYPSESYIDRRLIQTSDTSFTRVLHWTARAVLRADRLVFSRLHRDGLSQSARRCFGSALELPEVRNAPIDALVSEFDLDVCKSAGGFWLPLARIARLIAALNAGSATAQLYSLLPILPEFPHQLFELGVLGTIASGVRGIGADQVWSSAAPFAASTAGKPALTMTSTDHEWYAYYQSVPLATRTGQSPYLALTEDLQGQPLRPDIWIEQRAGNKRRQLVIECKYSLDPAYVVSGVTQVFSYWVEFPPPTDVQRTHVVVGPEEIVPATRVWNGQFVLTNPGGARELCRASLLVTSPEVQTDG